MANIILPPGFGNTGPMEKLWNTYYEMELRHKSLTGEQIKELQKVFFTGAYCMMTLTIKAMQLPDVAATNLLNEANNEIRSFIQKLRVKQGTIDKKLNSL